MSDNTSIHNNYYSSPVYQNMAPSAPEEVSHYQRMVPTAPYLDTQISGVSDTCCCMPFFDTILKIFGAIKRFFCRAPKNTNLKAMGMMIADTAYVQTVSHNTKVNPIPPRLQWNANYGYCGETSFISAGLYYGQYISQYTARSIASPGKNQSKEGSQLLLGVNDAKAAAAMHLKATPWTKGQNSQDFLAWVKANVLQGQPVVIGVYENMSIFGDDGEDGYDHIVPVTGIDTNHDLTDFKYYGDDTIRFSDNGLYGDDGVPPQYNFQYNFDAFQASRNGANKRGGAVYYLANDDKNYGIAFSGVMDKNGDTLPVRLTVDKNSEMPEMKDKSNTAPAPENLTLTVTVSKLAPSTTYNLYKYSDMSKVPDGDFNAYAKSHGIAPFKVINGSDGATFTMQDKILSSDTAVYRAVKTTAP